MGWSNAPGKLDGRLMPDPGMESAGKCPTIARVGMGTAGID